MADPSQAAGYRWTDPTNLITGGSGGGITAATATNIAAYGLWNIPLNYGSLIYGGQLNEFQYLPVASSIIGGTSNTVGISGWNSVIVGGATNAIGGGNNGTFIGANNIIGPYQSLSVIVSGNSNKMYGSSSTILGGNNIYVGHTGTTVIGDTQTAILSDTGDNQLLIRKAGGVAINTNNPGTNALEVAGNVDSTSGFSINGTPLTSVVLGGIASLFGHGTNTTLEYPTATFYWTNYYWTNVVISSNANALVNGTYVPCTDTNSPYYTNWSIYFNGDPTSFVPELVWTNVASTNFQMLLYTNGYANDIAWGPNVFMLGSLTNTVLNLTTMSNLYISPVPVGQWPLGVPSGVFGSGDATPLHLQPIHVLATNQFGPVVFTFPIDATGQRFLYSVPHQLGHVPWLVNWYFQCVHYDTNSMYEPGDIVDLRTAGNSSSFGDADTWKNSTYVGLSCASPIAGANDPSTFGGHWSLEEKDGNGIVTPTSVTNWLLRVEIMP